MTGPGFLDRWGEALVAPRRAMARADAAPHGGRPGTDLALAVLVAVVVAHTRALVAAGWIAVELGPRPALAPLIAALTATATVPLAVVAVATAVIWLAAGRRRDLGRDADLACVVALPPLAVAMITASLVRLVDVPPRLAWLAVAAAGVWPAVTAMAIARRRGAA